jgi:hypothetical protein
MSFKLARCAWCVVYTLHQIYQSAWHLCGPQLDGIQKAARHLESQECCAIRERRTKTEHQRSATIKMGQKSCRTHRINVGPSPRVNALMPSVLHTVRTQCSVDRYFCPSDGENPSVCIRDLTISMGYITAQSFLELGKSDPCPSSVLKRSTHSIACRRAIQDRATRAYLLSPNAR